MATRKTGLGRGLEALLGNSARGPSPTQATEAELAGDGLRRIAVDALQPGKYQPRTRIDASALTELADSIRAQGVIQPIVAREIARGVFEIIAGERRWRAAREAGLAEVPVVLRDVDDRSVIAMALIENIQREDLNPLEEAQGVQRLIAEFAMTHEQAAAAVGRSRSGVTNLLRLLALAKPVQELVLRRRLDMGHARALLALPPALQIELAHRIDQQKLSVREAEALVRRQLAPRKATSSRTGDADIRRLEEELADALGTRVEIVTGKGAAGRLVIHYGDLDQLDGILGKVRANRL